MYKPLALVIEDERDLSTLFTSIMRKVGFETEQVLDGKKALVRVAETKADVIVLDMHLPHVSGPDILKKIRGDNRLNDTKVIVITADSLTGNKLSGEADFILIKPITANQLKRLSTILYNNIIEEHS